MSGTTYPARDWPENQSSETPEADGEGRRVDGGPARASYALSTQAQAVVGKEQKAKEPRVPSPKDYDCSWGDIEILTKGLNPNAAVKILMDRFYILPALARAWLEMLRLTKICAAGDCARPVIAKGLCRLHYNRAWRANDPSLF